MNEQFDKIGVAFFSMLLIASVAIFAIYTRFGDQDLLVMLAMVAFAISWFFFGTFISKSGTKTKNNELFAVLLEQLHEHIITIRPDGTIVSLDSHDDADFEAPIVGSLVYDAFKLTDPKQLKDTIRAAVKTGEKQTVITKAVHGGKQAGWYEYRISPVWNGNKVELLILAIHNVTDREKEIKIYEILSSIGSTLLSTSDIESGLKKATHILSHVIRGGSVFVYQIDGNHAAKNIALEHNGKEIRARKKVLGDLFEFSLNDFPSVRDRLRLRKSFLVDAHEHAVEDRYVVRLMQDKYIDSLIIIPIVVRDSVIGFFGLAGDNESSCWRSSDIPRFNLIADILSVFIERQLAVTELSESNRQKSDFISIVSHQLQGPIASVKWNVELLKEGDAGKPTKKMIDVLSDIEEAGEQMKDLVLDLLHVSRIEQGRVVASSHATDLIGLIPAAINEIDAIAHQKQIKITLEAPKEAIVHGDQNMLKQVLQNLLNNAVKYSHEKSEVLLRVTKKRHNVQIEVIDEGIGIPKDEIRQLFTKFYRASNACEAAVEGSGLGLYVVKSFIDIMHGTVEVTSKVNEGTTVTVYLPLNP